MYPIIENIGASDPNTTSEMSDCPHDHIKDTGIERLRTIVREETDDGRKIVRFLVKAMDGELPGFQPHHGLEAAKILSNLGSDEAAEFVRNYGTRTRKARRSSNGAIKASDLGQSDPYLVIEPEISDIARFIREETSSGRTIVLRLIQIMETIEDPYKPHHNFAAAKELLNRGWSMPNAVECSWLCTHHVSESYFNGKKAQNPVLSLPKGANAPATSAAKALAELAVEADSAPSTTEAPASTAVVDSPEARPEPAEEPAPYPDTGASPEPTRRAGFTDIDSLPEHYWTRVLEMCQRLEERGTIPQLPLGPDDPLPDAYSIRISDFPEVDLTDDDVAERFWERVAEQIEIQEDWSEMWHYRPYRGDPYIWKMALDLSRRDSLPPPDS